MICETTQVDILLVEDNPADAELAMRMLRKNNLANRIEWVKDGEVALAFLFRRGEFADSGRCRPKVVLLDLRLPKVDGIEVLKAIRASPETKHIPVVVLTSSKEDKDLVAAYDLGVNSYVRKPIAFDEFSRTVTELGMYWLRVNRIPYNRCPE